MQDNDAKAYLTVRDEVRICAGDNDMYLPPDARVLREIANDLNDIAKALERKEQLSKEWASEW